MKLVIIESPYAGTSRFWLIRKFQQWRNVRYARACVRDSLKRGESPIASHLLYTQPGILNDDIPAERKLGIDAGLAWREVAGGTVVYTDYGTSKGMSYGITTAAQSGNPVEFRSIGKNNEN